MTQTDRLETILKAEGLPQYAQSMEAAAKSTDRVALSQERIESVLPGLAGGFRGILSGIGLATSAYLLLERATRLFSESSAAASDAARRGFQAQILFGSQGRGAFLPRLEELATQLQRVTGFEDDTIITTGVLLARFRLTNEQIERALPILANFARAEGIDIQEAAHLADAAMLGRARALEFYTGKLKLGKDAADNLRVALAAMDRVSGGAGAAFRATLPGSQEAQQSAWANFLEAIGKRNEPTERRVRNWSTKFLENRTHEIERGQWDWLNPLTALRSEQETSDWWGKLGENIGRRQRGLGPRWDLRTGTDLLAQHAQAAARTGDGFKQKDSDNMARMAEGMMDLKEALLKQVLGAGGDAARRVLNIRNAQQALRTT